MVAGGTGFVPATPSHLRAARTCYDHIAGSLGVQLHDRFVALRWLQSDAVNTATYEVTTAGVKGFEAFGIDVADVRTSRRRVAFACLDWSERRAHLGGALGAAMLDVALGRRWISREPGSRALSVTPHGRREIARRLGLSLGAD